MTMMTERQMVALESTLLAAALYCQESSVLELVFRDGSRYHYFHVPGDIYHRLLSADSKGRFFNQSIRGLYSYARIDDHG